ncbi:MAG: zinc-ribbon domain-containing protein, partial [Smithella sp.]
MQSKSTIKYSLQVCNSNIAREWHPTKNGSLTPSDVSVGSNRKVWWLCSKCHAWPATVSERN